MQPRSVTSWAQLMWLSVPFIFIFLTKRLCLSHLYEETADFLLQTIRQAIAGRASLPQQINAGLQAYVNIAVYEPTVIHLLLVGGVGAVPSLTVKRTEFRDRLIRIWQRALEAAREQGMIGAQNSRRLSEALVGAYDEVILNLLNRSDPADDAVAAVHDLTQFTLRAIDRYTGVS